MARSAVRVVTVLVLGMFLIAGGAHANEQAPKPDKMKKLSFPDFREFKTDNGIDVIVVEHHEQPVVSIYCVVRTGVAADPIGKEALSSFVSDQLNKGTRTRSSLELAEWIESVGGSTGGSSTTDYSALSVSVLTEHLGVAYQYLQDILLNPVFPEEELELLKKQMKTALEFEMSSPAAMARRHLVELVYQDHPYGKLATPESVESITQTDLVDFYKKNYVANNCLMIVVGDVKWKNVKKAMKNYFGGWERGTPVAVAYEGATDPEKTRIYLYHKPGAVQTEIRVGHLAPKAESPDWAPIVVANQILGAGAASRLFLNIRDEKGWTYSVSTSFSRERDRGIFVASTPVRTEVTDSVLVELISEVGRIREEPVTAEELKNAKSYLIGRFPITIETPDQIATQVAEYKLLGLGKKQLETYRERIDRVTVEDVQRAMREYIQPERSYIVLVGDATEIRDKVSGLGEVSVFDIGGEPLSLESMAVSPADHQYDTSALGDLTLTYSLTVQQMPLGDMNVTMKKKSENGQEVFEVSSSIAGFLVLEESMVFRADNLSPVFYKQSLKAGPTTTAAELAFTDTAGSGTVQPAGAAEPKEVTFELVDGTILGGSVRYALGCLALDVNKSYRFPVVDGQTGTLQSVDVEVLEATDIETAAGTFAVFKIRVRRPDGESFIYLQKDSPHTLVKHEVPAQMMTIELKAIAQ